MAILLRTLTLKSKIGFGEFKIFTVGEVIRNFPLGTLRLGQMYFTASKINFNNEVLELLYITAEFRIIKPGKDKGKYGEWRQHYNSVHRMDNDDIKRISIDNNYLKRKISLSDKMLSVAANNRAYNQSGVSFHKRIKK